MATSQSQDNVLPNSQKPSDTWGEFNNISYLVQQAIGKIQTATIVRIEKCTNNGGLTPVGYVDVTPMVSQIDAAGVTMPHTTIYNVPYFRIQGGANAIIIDPEIGDLGICVFASRDITKVKNTKAQSAPGSFRQNSFSDGLYIGGVLNGLPAQYVQFSATGIRIHSPTKIKLDAPDILLSATTIEINASASVTMTTPIFQLNGEMNATGDIVGQGTSLHTHVHGGIAPGPSNTGQPV